jgi:CheY-specific phosphatase CheX
VNGTSRPSTSSESAATYSLGDVALDPALRLEDLSEPASDIVIFPRKRHVTVVAYAGAGASALPEVAAFSDQLPGGTTPIILHWVGTGKPAADQPLQSWIEAFSERIGGAGRTLRIFPQFAGTRIPAEAFTRDLRSALFSLGLLPAGSPDPDVVETFGRAVATFFHQQMNTDVHLLAPVTRSSSEHIEGFTTWMEFRGGSLEIATALTFPKTAVEPLIQRMVGDEAKLKQQEMWAGTCEFLNIISGLARSHLNARGYTLKAQGLPALYVPEYQDSLFEDDGSTRISIPFETPHGRAELEVRFYNAY